MRKLTEQEVLELRECKHQPHGDMLYWEKLEEIYKDDEEAMKRIAFEKDYLRSVEAIPYEYASHWKTEKLYLETVDEFNNMIGYTPEPNQPKEFEDSLLEMIAAKFGVDIDINGDGMTSFEKYKNK